jgi:hypothetical protein
MKTPLPSPQRGEAPATQDSGPGMCETARSAARRRGEKILPKEVIGGKVAAFGSRPATRTKAVAGEHQPISPTRNHPPDLTCSPP